VRIVSVVGARPQFIKAAPLVRALAAAHTSILIHTGQHYDENMSDVFFDELDLPKPDHHLGVGSGTHAVQTAKMLSALEPVLIAERPDWVIVYGDTNSTLAGALVASKLETKLAHVEAGLRSFNRSMPEEINRIVADGLSTRLFCPSLVAVENLSREGIVHGVFQVGDLMAEALADARQGAERRSNTLERLGLAEGGFILATVHRAENTDRPDRLAGIMRALAEAGEPVVFPVHPRTRAALQQSAVADNGSIRFIDPLGYLDMVRFESAARLIVTDSGGVQKEAYWLGTPCVTVRDETEWVETVEAGWNVLAGADPGRILDAIRNFRPASSRPALYSGASPSRLIVELLSGDN
jgi:UDP-N-acetylglucosamine 2-epimerase